MIRVSSCQPLVSWDHFDASSPEDLTGSYSSASSSAAPDKNEGDDDNASTTSSDSFYDASTSSRRSSHSGPQQPQQQQRALSVAPAEDWSIGPSEPPHGASPIKMKKIVSFSALPLPDADEGNSDERCHRLAMMNQSASCIPMLDKKMATLSNLLAKTKQTTPSLSSSYSYDREDVPLLGEKGWTTMKTTTTTTFYPPKASPSLKRSDSELTVGLAYMTPQASAADMLKLLECAADPSLGPRAPVRRRGPGLADLPDDALHASLAFLTARDLRSASASCRGLREAVAGRRGRHLWLDLARGSWQLLVDPATGAVARGGGLRLADDAGVLTAAVPPSCDGRGEREGGGDDVNLSALLGLSAATQPCAVELDCRLRPFFRFYDAVPPAPETGAGLCPLETDRSDGGSYALRVDGESWRRTRAQDLLRAAGGGAALPVVQFTGKVGSGDRCIRSDAPLPRPKIQSRGWAWGATPPSDDDEEGISHCAHRWRHRTPLSSSPTQSLIELLRRGKNLSKKCGHDGNSRGRWKAASGPGPFVSPYVRIGSDNQLEADLTPRLVAYFEVSILPRNEGQEPENKTENAPFSLRPPAAAAALVGPATAPARPQQQQQQQQRRAPTLHHPIEAFVPAMHPLLMMPVPVPPPQLLPRSDNNAPAAVEGNGNNSDDCIAVGVSTSSFLPHHRMPGWDQHSYGYHGDDGGIFHDAGDMEKVFGPKYGAGDTVGCGVDYVNGGIFFTLNGRFLGYGWTGVDYVRDKVKLYPTVGVDTNCPVACNFGERPFAFDLGEVLEKHEGIVQRSLGGLVPTEATKEY